MTATHTLLLTCTSIAALLGACGGEEPLSVSSPIGINLKAEEGDVKDNNVINVEKSITSESGNPWGAFIADVEDQLGGPPGDIELESLELTLAATSDGVTELREVFQGTIDIQFQMNDTDNVFGAASVVIDDSVEGRSIAMDPSFDYGDFQGVDLDKLLGGSYKVVLGAPAHPDFAGLKAKGDLQLTFDFAAFE